MKDELGIGLERARMTLKASSQRGVRSVALPISHQCCADRQFNVKRSSGEFATDTLWSKVKSLWGNVAAQTQSNEVRFAKAHHLSKANDEQVGCSSNSFVTDCGALEDCV